MHTFATMFNLKFKSMVKTPKTTLVANLVASLVSQENTLHAIKSSAEGDIASLVIALVGMNTPITFNEETGFPVVIDTCDDERSEIISVRINEDGIMEFNNDADPTGDDDYGLEPTGWYSSFEVDYDITDLRVSIMNTHNYKELFGDE